MVVSIEFSEQFLEDAGQIYSPGLAKRLKRTILLLEVVPTMGSKIIRDSLKKRFGKDIFKLVVEPFDLIYTYDEAARCVRLHALVPQKTVK